MCLKRHDLLTIAGKWSLAAPSLLFGFILLRLVMGQSVMGLCMAWHELTELTTTMHVAWYTI